MRQESVSSPAELRLQKYLAEAGLGSRRACEQLIVAGRVSVNGQTVGSLGTKVRPGLDQVSVDGRRLPAPQPKVHLVINKPLQVVCTNRDTHGRQRVIDLLPPELPRVYSVGRLDYWSEGLLLLTNDGSFSLRLTHPRYKMPKVYRVTVTGLLSDAAVNQLRQGIASGGEWLRAEEVQRLDTAGDESELQIVLREGKNRQIRRMLAAVGHPVRRLVRTAIGQVRLGNLQPGQWRMLSHEEIRQLLQN